MAIDFTNLMALGPTIGKWAVNITGLILFAAVAYSAAYWYNRKKRFNWIVRIFNKDATGNIIQLPDDKGGIFIDKKTQFRLFLLRKTKFGLDPDEIPYILSSSGQRIVYLIQTGLKNFQFMKPTISDNPGLVFNVQDEDVAWALNAYERNKKVFQNDFLQKIMPFIGMAFVFMIVVMGLYFVFKNLGSLSDIATAMNTASETMKETAKLQSLGTVVE